MPNLSSGFQEIEIEFEAIGGSGMTKPIIIQARTQGKLNEMIGEAFAKGIVVQRRRYAKGAKLPYVAEGFKEGAE